MCGKPVTATDVHPTVSDAQHRDRLPPGSSQACAPGVADQAWKAGSSIKVTIHSALPSAYPLDRLRRCSNQVCQLTYRVQGPREAPIELAFIDGIPVLVDYCWGCGGEDFEDVGIHELGMQRRLPERGAF